MKKKMSTTVEPQYQFHVDYKNAGGLISLGIEKSGSWQEDPRRLLFALSRYKFVGKMLSGLDNVLEVGCGDGWPIPILLQEVKHVHGIDIDPIFINDIRERGVSAKWNYTYAVHNMLNGPVEGEFDAAFSLDVLEHISISDEDRFLKNIILSLKNNGIAIFGMPSLNSQQYASVGSKAGHVNCKNGQDLKLILQKYFKHVFIFSMNDEVVHTGFQPMAHYLFALCTGIRDT